MGYFMANEIPIGIICFYRIVNCTSVRHFVSIQLEAESKQCFQGFTYGFELLEVTGVSGPAAMVCSLRSESVKRSGLIVGDIIYQVDEVKVSYFPWSSYVAPIQMHVYRIHVNNLADS